MNIWHLVFRPDSLTYTIAKALSHAGQPVSIWVTDAAFDAARATTIEKRVADTLGVTVIERNHAQLPDVIDRLIVQVFPRPTESLVNADRLASRARKITLITAGDRSRTWRTAMKLQWQEALVLRRYARKVDRVLYKDGFYASDLLGLLKTRNTVGFDTHSQFLHDRRMFETIHARDWRPDTTRPVLASFLGSRDPAVREHILASVRSLFRSDAPVATRGNAKKMYWHEYSDAAPNGLAPEDFVKLLTESDFSLCPRGYSLVTHRPIEALLRGSIPVLASDELDLYGVDLEDGTNCIGVSDGRWTESVERVLAMDESSIVSMRSRIHAMFDAKLDYAAIAERIRLRVGAL
jgi:hypothetical protein